MTRSALGIDVGGTTIKSGLVDAAGHLRRLGVRPTPRTVEELVAAVAEIADAAPATGTATVGVAVPGIVDEDAGLGVWSANLGWHDAPLARLFARRLGRPVAFGHDVRSGARAELRWGDAPDSFVYLPIGTGISAAIVAGRTILGADGWAGELGQCRIADPDRPEHLVALESVASAAGIARRYRQLTGQGRDTAAIATASDATARLVVDQAMTALAEVLAPVCSALSPQAVILGGGLSQAGEPLLERLRNGLSQRLGPDIPPPLVRATTLGADAQLLGAAELALRREGLLS